MKSSAHPSTTFQVRIWDIPSQSPRCVLAGHTAIVLDVAFGVDGAIVASCAADGTLRLWDVAEEASLQTISPASTGGFVQVQAVGGRLSLSNHTFLLVWLYLPSCLWCQRIVWPLMH